jgi:hypothetical protein
MTNCLNKLTIGFNNNLSGDLWTKMTSDRKGHLELIVVAPCSHSLVPGLRLVGNCGELFDPNVQER